MKRRICFVSGKRGGFGVLSRTMKNIMDDPELELKLIITDMHLSERFGKTKEEVNKHFNVDYEVDIIKAEGDTRTERAKALGRCLTGMVDALNATKPDLLLLYGDRGEIVATALAAVNLGVPIVHLQGGEVTGGLDEPFRHALTKLANIHLVSTELSKERILSLGEEEWRITVVGQPHIDLILNKEYAPEPEIRKKFGIQEGEKLVIALQHPVSTNPGNSYRDMKETMEAIKRLGHKTILIYPCSDQGYSGIIKAIEEYEELAFLQTFKNLEFPYFLGLLSIADVFIGNSSSAIIEAPYFCLPTVNIGERQQGRERSDNVLDVGYDADEIYAAAKKAIDDETFRRRVRDCRKIFGTECVSDKIVRTLKEITIDMKLHQKRIILRP